MSNFPERDSDDATKLDRLRGYAIAIEGYSVAVLQEASRRIFRGGIPDIDPRFMPTPPQLARLCSAIRAEQVHREPAPLNLERFDAPPDPRIAARFGKAVADLTRVADIVRHESRREWIERMGARVKKSAVKPMSPENAAIYHGDIDGDFNY